MSEAIDRFRRYEENFLNSTRIISRTLARLSEANGNIDTVIATSVEIESELSETEGYLRAMDVEHRTITTQDKRQAQEKVNEYRSEYREMLQKFKSTRHNAETLALRGGGNESRNKLLNTNSKLDRSTATLNESRAIVAQTEQIGSTIITDMGNQREILLNADSKVEETRGFAAQAKSVLKMMSNRAYYHKLCIYTWIIVLFACICLIIYYGFIAPDEKQSKR
jgi:vesicle transport through interaction with t-SNAREs 1